jgi:hypothetical protein
VEPLRGLVLGGAFNIREREFPDIRVKSEGRTAAGHARYRYRDWGGVSGTYTFAEEKYDDLAGAFDVNSHAVTARLDFEKIKRLRLGGGVTYLEVGEDLDIEKSILFFEGEVAVLDDLRLEAKYNVYNYDDYLIRDRYYTANVVWFNVAYDLHVE